MTIGKKLYYGFGAVLALVAFITIIILVAMGYDRSAKEKMANLFEVQRVTADVGFQMMQNRQNLGNYLLSGDTRGADDMAKGVTKLDGQLEKAIAQVQGEAAIKEALQKILKEKTEVIFPATGKQGRYDDLVKGRVDVDFVARLERKNDSHTISNKTFDFSKTTIQQLIQDGYEETREQMKGVMVRGKN